MNFWKALRWISALLFVAMVLLAWLVSIPRSMDDDGTRAAPVIVR
jgi:hypothetical protein